MHASQAISAPPPPPNTQNNFHGLRFELFCSSTPLDMADITITVVMLEPYISRMEPLPPLQAQRMC